MPEAPAAPLGALLAAELDAPVPPPVRRMAEAVRTRHRGAAAVLFYGSCLRRDTTEGVLDFYLLVDGYRAAHRSRLQAALGCLLPPNVFYLEHEDETGTLRAKYALISLDDFERAVTRRSFDCRIWSRFCQPARLVWARDAAAAARARQAVETATLTAIERMLTWLPGEGSLQRFRPGDLWTGAFRETYRAELRGENAVTIDAIYALQADRFDRVALAALRVLEARGALGLRPLAPEAGPGTLLEVESDAGRRRWARRAWRLRRPIAKALAVAGLVKTPATFEGWVSYALWKVERHSGVRIELSERQRRRPFLHAAPILFRLWRQRALR